MFTGCCSELSPSTLVLVGTSVGAVPPRKAQLNIAKTLPVRALGEGLHAKLLGTAEMFDVAVAVAPGTDSMKALPRQEVHDLCEERRAEVHARLRE